MGKYRRYKNKLEMFLASNRGKRILNLFYSWGAACVILGALMEILRVPYGDIVLAVSMLVEFAVFFISGFEKPQQSYNWEEVFPELDSSNPIDREEIQAKKEYLRKKAIQSIEDKENNNTSYINSKSTLLNNSSNVPTNDIEKLSNAITSLSVSTEQLARISKATTDMIVRYEDINKDYQEVSKSSSEYSKEMQSLTKNINGLNTIYELQLKGISSQIETIDSINSGLKHIKNMYNNTVDYSDTFREQNELMASQLKQLNSVYARLLEALTVNMNIQQGINNKEQ